MCCTIVGVNLSNSLFLASSFSFTHIIEALAKLQKENEELHARLQVRDDLQERRHRSGTDPTHFYDTKSISSRSEFEMSAFPPPVDELNSKPRPVK